MVDYIKMTQQASDVLNHQDMQVSGALSQERAKKDGPVNAAAGGNGLDGKRGMG